MQMIEHNFKSVEIFLQLVYKRFEKKPSSSNEINERSPPKVDKFTRERRRFESLLASYATDTAEDDS